MRAFKIIRDPKAFQLIGDATRRRMIHLLRGKEMTVGQLADELQMTPQAIYHHIRKLRDVGMVEVSKEERVGHLLETYYQAAAEVFEFQHGKGPAEDAYLEREISEALTKLPELGFDVKVSQEVVKRLVDLQSQIKMVGADEALSERAASLEGVGFLAKQTMAHFARLLRMTDAEFEEYLHLEDQFRKELRSLLVTRVPSQVLRASPNR